MYEKITSFTHLNAWKEAYKLVLIGYKATKHFPRDELYVLTSQIRRCLISIASNIAEGFSRNSRREKIQFYYVALGSVTEFQNQLLIAKDLHYIDTQTFKRIAQQTVTVHKLINGLIKTAQSKNT